MTNESNLSGVIMQQCAKYPAMQVQDLLKLVYQNEFGCGHMVTDTAHSLEMITNEVRKLSADALVGDVFEYIGNNLCRLNLRVLQQTTLAPETLNSFFMLTANKPMGSHHGFEAKAAELITLCENGAIPFDANEVTQALAESRISGHPPQRHSEEYRTAYKPAYRVVNKTFCDFIELFCKIDGALRTKECVTASVEGNCAAGKSTLAALLQEVYSCNVFRADDFFLQPHQRTPERFSEPGGNLDRERFAADILQPLQLGQPFNYRPYNCRTQELDKAVAAEPKRLNVVEGVYCLHPYFGDTYDIKVFMELDESEQHRRLMERNPNMYDRFVNEWIPLENKYFEAFQIPQKCEMRFNTGELSNPKGESHR